MRFGAGQAGLVCGFQRGFVRSDGFRGVLGTCQLFQLVCCFFRETFGYLPVIAVLDGSLSW